MSRHPEVLAAFILISACGQLNHADQPEDDSLKNPGGSATPPLFCETCAGGDTTDFGGEPPDCISDDQAVTENDASELGYQIGAFLNRVEGSFSAPVVWRANGSGETTLTASVVVTGLTFSEREPVTEAECPDLLFVRLRIDLATVDSTILGRLEGDTALSNPGALADPLWVSVQASADEFRGTLRLDTGDLGPPLALQARFDMVISKDARDPRLGIELSGIFGRDLDSGVQGYAVGLESAQPTDGCPAFALPDGETCTNAPVP